jgi:hypothetical protein
MTDAFDVTRLELEAAQRDVDASMERQREMTRMLRRSRWALTSSEEEEDPEDVNGEGDR